MTELPPGWAVTTLGSLCNPPQYGWTTSARKNRSTGLKFLRTTDISHGTLDWGSVPVCSVEPPNPEHYELAPGDIVISRAGSVGLSYRLTDVVPAVFASYLIRFRPSKEIDGRYLAYYLQSRAYWSQIAAVTSGITLANVNAKKLSAIEVPLAPGPEQERIVAAIEEQFSRLDASLAALDSALRKLDSFRLSVLRMMREGTWDRAPFGVLVENYDGRRVPVKADQRRKGPYPYYGAQGIIDYVDGFLFDGDYVLVAEDGANLLSRNLPIAVQAHGKFWVNNHAHVVQPKPGMLPEYLTAVMNADSLAGAITGSAQPKLPQKALNRLLIPTPPLEEQRKLVAYMERAATGYDAAQQTVRMAALRAQTLRSSILVAAYSGNLVTQDPSSEPATLLLGRIAGMRASNGHNTSRARKQRKTGRKVPA
jgi:type I restriction enzyme S subunit